MRINALLFGPERPDVRLECAPGGTVRVRIQNQWLFEDPEFFADPEATLTWRRLYANVNDPHGHAARYRQPNGIPHWQHWSREGWLHLVTQLRQLCRSETEVAFFDKLTRYQVECHTDESTLWDEMAIIPQYTVNWTAYMPGDAEERNKRRMTPFVVDFLMVVAGTYYAIEIDGPSHFKTPADHQITMAKNRWMVKHGWKAFRFHVADVDMSSALDMLEQMGLSYDDDIPF